MKFPQVLCHVWSRLEHVDIPVVPRNLKAPKLYDVRNESRDAFMDLNPDVI